VSEAAKERENMYLIAEVIFYAGQRKQLPADGYRPDAVFNGLNEYRGITFTELPIEEFDAPTPAAIKFSFQDAHYQEVVPGQVFKIMEGLHQVGEGRIISIEK
jgi:hypothetical protein